MEGHPHVTVGQPDGEICPDERDPADSRPSRKSRRVDSGHPAGQDLPVVVPEPHGHRRNPPSLYREGIDGNDPVQKGEDIDASRELANEDEGRDGPGRSGARKRTGHGQVRDLDGAGRPMDRESSRTDGAAEGLAQGSLEAGLEGALEEMGSHETQKKQKGQEKQEPQAHSPQGAAPPGRPRSRCRTKNILVW